MYKSNHSWLMGVGRNIPHPTHLYLLLLYPNVQNYAGLLYLTSQSITKMPKFSPWAKRYRITWITLKKVYHIFACRKLLKLLLWTIFTVQSTCVALEILHVQDGQGIFKIQNASALLCLYYGEYHTRNRSTFFQKKCSLAQFLSFLYL